METYFIHEDNLERLEKKINTIKNKCTKNNLSFTYIVGEPVFRNLAAEGEPENIQRFFPVQVEGSIKHNDWVFAATIAHVADSANIVRAYEKELKVPEKYYTCGPTCEHCNKIRSRKDTYLIYNTVTEEFKQVGKTCMQEYTNGLDAEEVAKYIALFDEMIKGYAPSGAGLRSYKSVEELLQYSFECVKHWGYHKADEQYSTRSRVLDYIWAKSPSCPPTLKKKAHDEQLEVSFDIKSDDTLANVVDALNWIRNEKDDYGYISNLKAACLDDYTESRNTGLIVSLPAAYFNHIGYQKKVAEANAEKEVQKQKDAQSEYQGEVGKRISFSPASAECVTSFDGYYGTTWLYKFTDDNNNVYIWYSSNPVKTDKEIDLLTGTVKDHSEYRGVKQTVLTRCKIEYSTEVPERFDAEEVKQEVDNFLEVIDMLYS